MKGDVKSIEEAALSMAVRLARVPVEFLPAPLRPYSCAAEGAFPEVLERNVN